MLYGKFDHLEKMPPYQGGGRDDTFCKFRKRRHLMKFRINLKQAHQNIADVIALGVTIDYLQSMDRSAALNHELGLMEYASLELSK